jgi:hypothetical protein
MKLTFSNLESFSYKNMQLFRYGEATETSRVYTIEIELRFKREIEYMIKTTQRLKFQR